MRDVNALVKLFEQNGFTLARSQNHMVWYCPCGKHVLTVAKSSGGGRGHANIRSQLRRTLRECATPQEETAS